MWEAMNVLGWLGGLGVITLGSGIWSRRVRRRRQRTWRREQAWAVGEVTRRVSTNALHRYLLYERRDERGGYRVVESLTNAGITAPTSFPCRVDVLVDPENPYRVQEADAGGAAFAEIVFMGVGVVVLIAAVVVARGLL